MPDAKSTLFFFVISFLFCISTNLQGQSANTYHHYTTKDGLPSNYVYGAMQDRDGYIWFYTEKGISKFDGYSFKNYQEELPNYDVWGLVEDSHGRLWVQVIHNRLVYIYQDSIHEVTTPGNIRFHINSINEFEGTTWFSTSSSFDGSKKGSENFYIRNDTAIHIPTTRAHIKSTVSSTRDEILFNVQAHGHYVFFQKDSFFRYDYNGNLKSESLLDNTESVEDAFEMAVSSISVSYKMSKDEFHFFVAIKKQA